MKTEYLKAEAVKILREHNRVSFSRDITSQKQMADIARALDLDCVYWNISDQYEMRKRIDILPESKACIRVWSKDWARA